MSETDREFAETAIISALGCLVNALSKDGVRNLDASRAA